MSIFQLPTFEEDADPSRRDAMTLEEQLAATKPSKTLVVKFGRMSMIGEYQSSEGIRAGCGSKLVAQTHRGVELSTLLTTTCPNAGCDTSVSRQEMRDYIDASGGRDYPFFDRGRILRIATPDDLRMFTEREGDAQRMVAKCKELVKFYVLDMNIIDAELTLDGEQAVMYYHSEQRVDFRDLAQEIGAEFRTKLDMRQVGSRDEAKLVADYEKCGQHCCCKTFLKVLKPVSMRTAKQQKATLDPIKISGRCGRLMCCLRYEDSTYRDLKANLPHRKTRVGTMEGPGIVMGGQILTQLVEVKLEADSRHIAVPVEELMDPDNCPAPGEHTESERRFGDAPDESEERIPEKKKSKGGGGRKRGGRGDRTPDSAKTDGGSDAAGGSKKKRQRRRRKSPADGGGDQPQAQAQSTQEGGAASGGSKKKRRRRRGGRKKEGGSPASPE
jgi:cell fate regulator YaaT (PSP1 superfamily)|tara:strand:+ start:278 stop:1603 length:1326 start_codon:yes stop_codon:yes gene_type:complete